MKKNKRTQQKSSPPFDYSPAEQLAPDLVAAMAYAIWEKEGHPTGRDVEHWLQAEAQLRHCSVPDLS